jgi:outer membrane protein assembly factor BamB
MLLALPPRVRSIVLPAALAVGLGAVCPPAARADTIDPTMPRTVVVGPPRGAAPSERLDPFRSGHASTNLPAAPVELWRRHVSGNIDVPPLVDASDALIVALTIPELIKIGPDAREIWRQRLGAAAPIAAPTLLSDGTIAVVTAAGIAWGFTSNGTLRFSTPLGVPRRDTDTAPLALADGGLLIAAGGTLVELDNDGAIRARAALDDRPGSTERATGAVLDSPLGALVTTVSGSVYRFRAPSPPRRVGSFGGTTARGAALADDRTLVAVVDGRRLVALDLPTGTTHVRAGGLPLDGPPTIGPAGLVLVSSQLGTLFGVDAAGNERAHVALEKAPLAASGVAALTALLTPPDLKPSPPVVLDPGGRVGFVRGNGRAGVVSPNGRVEIASERVCPAPIAVVPAGERRMLVACHDGQLWMYGE